MPRFSSELIEEVEIAAPGLYKIWLRGGACITLRKAEMTEDEIGALVSYFLRG